jgi:two-component system OmpR family response regulator
MAMRLLVVEDDPDTAEYIRRGLKEHGHAVEVAMNGKDGLFLAMESSFDVIVADRMLPSLDGLAMVKAMRGAGIRTPVLFLTALGGIDDRVEGLESGGDDYLVKPFAFAELLARLNALSRRPPISDAPTVLRVFDLELDLLSRTVTRDGKKIELKPRELALLEYLLRHAGQVVTRTMLLENVWQFHFDPGTNVVETHVSRLRAKIDRGFSAELLVTLRGVGYSLREPA